MWSLWGPRWCCTCGFNSQYTPSPGPVTGCYEGVHSSPECFGGSFCWKIWKQQALRHLVSKSHFLKIKPLKFCIQCITMYHNNVVIVSGEQQRDSAIHICCCSVVKSCPTLCDPVGCTTPGSSVLHYMYSLSPKPPSHPGCHIILSRIPCWLSI